jgi:hypothetical protein
MSATRLRGPTLFAASHAALLLSLVPAAGAFAADGAVTVLLESGPFEVVSCEYGQRIEMEGFQARPEPGRPALPARRFLVALPPGAQVLGVETAPAAGIEIDGTWRIAATTPFLPLAEAADQLRLLGEIDARWRAEKAAAYATDAPWPEEPVELVGTGGLRKYAYACVSFTPFTYRARSGRLTHLPRAEVTVRYRTPEPGSAEALAAERALVDVSADEGAARLFVNFDAVKASYEPSGEPRPRSESWDYVIVTREAVLDAVTSTSFIPWKEALGHRVRVYDTVPMRYCFADPTNHAHDPTNYASPGGSVPTDYFYADLSLPEADSWDLDGDGYAGEYGEDLPDFLAEVSVGRIPINAATKIAYALEKSVAFEQDTGTWKDRALHGAAILFYENQNHSGVPYIDGARCMAQIQDDLMPGWVVRRRCEHEGLDPSSYPWAPLTPELFETDWRNGPYAVVNWSGHGSSHGAWRAIWDWDDGDGVAEFDGSDGMRWDAFISTGSSLDDDAPAIVFGVSCNVGYPEPNAYGRLGVDLLTLPGFGGAVSVLSASRVAAITRGWPDEPGGAESFCYDFNRYLLVGTDGPMRVGDALYEAKQHCHQNYPRADFYEYWNLYDYDLYGDPALDRRGVSLTGVADAAGGEAPVRRSTLRNRPNPFNPATAIEFALEAPEAVTVTVLDLAGRLVAVLLESETMSGGSHTVRWDGRDRSGRPVASGVYVCRLETGHGVETMRMVLLR